jgi:hypothetical protein
MSDSLTRLILRAQGRLPAGVVTAEPLLVSRHESDPGPGSADAPPWIAHEVEVETGSVGRPMGLSPHHAAHHTESPREGRIGRESMSNDPSEQAANDPRPVLAIATQAGASMPDTKGRDRTAEGPERRRTNGVAPFATPDRSPVDAGDKNDTPLPHQAPSTPQADGTTTDPHFSSHPIDQVQTGQPLSPRQLAAEPFRYQVVPPRAAGSPPVKPVFTPAVRAQSQPIAARPGDEAPAARDVSITIGLVEVRAVPPRASPPRPAAPRRPGTSLADYLAQRSGRSSS